MTLDVKRRFARHVVREAQLRAAQDGVSLGARELVLVLLLWLAMVGLLTLLALGLNRLWH